MGLSAALVICYAETQTDLTVPQWGDWSSWATCTPSTRDCGHGKRWRTRKEIKVLVSSTKNVEEVSSTKDVGEVSSTKDSVDLRTPLPPLADPTLTPGEPQDIFDIVNIKVNVTIMDGNKSLYIP